MNRSIVLALLIVLLLVPASAGVEMTKGLGYCVSVWLDGIYYGKVKVPFHRPDATHLEELRVSIANSYRLVALQIDGRDHAAAEKLRAGADRIIFTGEATTSAQVKRPIGHVVECVCATDYDSTVVGSPGCSGACGTCWLCGR